MSVYDCIGEALKQGAITAEEAETLNSRYGNVRAALAIRHANAKDRLGKDLDDEARRVLQGILKQEAERRRQLADLAVTAQNAIRENLGAFRDAGGKADVFEAAMRHLENFGFSGFSSVRGRQMSIISLVHGEMGDVLREFERNFITGFHHNTPTARNVVREMLGEATGDPAAKAFGDAATKAFETLRGRFNAAGGDIGHIEGGYVPQFHDPLALYKATFEKWRDFIAPRLDVARIKDPITGLPISPERMTESLRGAYDKIVTGGWDDRTAAAAPRGAGALANQRGDDRFFVFKSAGDWLDYDRQFGRGDPVKAIFQHINSIARDTAALEILGPNPGATVEWLKQVVQNEHGKALIGEPSLFNLENRGVYSMGLKGDQGRLDAGSFAAHRIDDLWQYVRGRQVVSQSMARVVGDARNILTSIQLGSASITAAMTDPAIEKAARGALDMPSSWLFGSNAKVFIDTLSRGLSDLPIVGRGVGFLLDKMTGAPRDQALRSGLIADEFLHVLGDEARYAGTLGGNVWSRWVADRTLMLSGLTPLTEARRSVFALDFQSWLADNAAKAFDELPPRLRTKMEGYGIDGATWDTVRAVPQYRTDPRAAGMIRPVDIATVDRTAAERVLEMLLGETERAIPTNNMRSKERFTSGGPKGTIGSELMESFLQYRSFGLSLLTLQMEAVAHETANMGAHAAGPTRRSSSSSRPSAAPPRSSSSK
jgi:hypothetical protein